MEIKEETISSVESSLNGLISLSGKLPNNPLGASLLNVFESICKYNEVNKAFILNFFQSHQTISADVASAFENPDCSCRKRFSDFLESNPEVSRNAFFGLFSLLSEKEAESVSKTLKGFYDHFKALSEEKNSPKNEEAVDAAQSSENKTESNNDSNVGANTNTTTEKNSSAVDLKTNNTESVSYIGKSFIIEKTQEAYAVFFEDLLKNKIQYNGISVMPYNLNQMMIVFY